MKIAIRTPLIHVKEFCKLHYPGWKQISFMTSWTFEFENTIWFFAFFQLKYICSKGI